MTVGQLKQYLEQLGFEETNRNTFCKRYRVRESMIDDKNYATLIYKVSKGVVYFKAKSAGQTSTLKKGSLEKIVVNENGELEGFKNSN